MDGVCARRGPGDRSWVGLGGPVSKDAVCGALGCVHQLCIDRAGTKNTHKCPRSIDIDRQLSRELGRAPEVGPAGKVGIEVDKRLPERRRVDRVATGATQVLQRVTRGRRAAEPTPDVGSGMGSGAAHLGI